MNRTLAITLTGVGLLTALIVAVIVGLLAAKPSIAGRRERGQAALTQACEAIPNVTIERCLYSLPGSLVGTTISVTLRTDGDSPAEVNQALTDAFKSVVSSARASDTPSRAGVHVTVIDSGGTVFGPGDVGLSATPVVAEVAKRFG